MLLYFLSTDKGAPSSPKRANPISAEWELESEVILTLNFLNYCQSFSVNKANIQRQIILPFNLRLQMKLFKVETLVSLLEVK